MPRYRSQEAKTHSSQIICIARVEAGAGNKASGQGSMLRRTAATATIAAGLG